MGISNRTMGHTGLAPALVLLLAVASAGLSHENPVALLQESTEQASTAGAHETVHTKKPKAPLTAAEKRHIQRDVAHDAQGVLQERAGAVDDKALLAAAQERLVEDLKVERKFRKETEAAAAELKKHTKSKEVEEKIVDPAPEVSMEKLETKLDELERVADEPLPELVTSEQIARAQEEAASGQPSADLVGGTEQVTADSLEAQALKRRHIDLENSVHEASRVSGEQLAAEAEAKRAQVHLEKLSENDVNNIARQVPNTK